MQKCRVNDFEFFTFLSIVIVGVGLGFLTPPGVIAQNKNINFVDDFDRELEDQWYLHAPLNTEVKKANSQLVFEDRKHQWGTGAGVVSKSSFSTGGSMVFTIRISDVVNPHPNGMSFTMGFFDVAELHYWYMGKPKNKERPLQRISFSVEGNKVWDSHIWNYPNLFSHGNYLRFRMNGNKWEILGSEDGKNFEILIADGKNPSYGVFESPPELKDKAPLHITMSNSRGQNVRAAFDDLDVHVEPSTTSSGVDVSGHEKLTLFTSMHCYPYNRAYSIPGQMRWVNYVDRPLYWNPMMGDREAAAKKAELMEQAGGDVYVQTVFYANGNPEVGGDTTTGLSVIGRTLKAVENTSLKVAPEVVAISRAERYGIADLAGFFRELYEQYNDHPRLFRRNGKMVVFLWGPFPDVRGEPPLEKFGPDDLQKVWDNIGKLRDKLYVVNETYYGVGWDIARLSNRWNDSYIQDMLSVCDNLFYWFSHLDYYSECMHSTKLANSLRQYAPGEPVIACSRPGYYRVNIGSINPHRGIGKLLELWDANQTISPDWNFFYNWDDYSENGVIEPTRRNRGVYSEVVKVLTRHWKDLPPKGQPQWWVGTRSVAVRGEHIETDVVGLRTGRSAPSISLIYETIDGKTICEREMKSPQEWANGRIRRWFFKTPTANFDADELIPIVRIVGKDGYITYRGIAPIRLLDHHPMLPLFRFVRLDQLQKPEEINFVLEPVQSGGQKAEVKGHFRITADRPIKRVELRSMMDEPMPYKSEALPFDPEAPSFNLGSEPRLSWKGLVYEANPSEVVEGFDPWYLPLRAENEAGIPDEDLHIVEGNFLLNTSDLHDPRGALYLFISYRNGGTYSSKPKMLPRVERKENATVNVFNWEEMGERGIRLVPERKRDIPLGEAMVAEWSFGNLNSNQEKVTGESRFGWPLYLGYGPNTRQYRGTEENRPTVVQGENGYLSFDGKDDIVRLPSYVFPPAAFSASLVIRVKNLPSKEATLMFGNRGLLHAKLLADGRVSIIRYGGPELISSTAISEGEWTEVAFSDDGRELRITVGGETVSLSHEPWNISINWAFADLVVIGGRPGGTFYEGDVRAVRLFIN